MQAPSKGALYRDGQSGRYLLGGTWLYRPDRADVGISQGWWRGAAGTSGWSPVAIPNAYNARDFSNASWRGYVGWYRRDFTVPRGAFAGYVPGAARRWIVRFESVNYRATVWLNGHLVGRHVAEELPFEFELSGVRRGVNRLIVRVDNRRLASDLPPGPGAGWWNYGGILREVYLRAAQRADIAQVRIRTLLRCPSCAARIAEQVLIRNVTGTTQTVKLRGAFGARSLRFGKARIRPHRTWSATAATLIRQPRLWSPRHPSLYPAILTLSDEAGRRLGGYFAQIGIRTIRVTRGGLLTLNGHRLNLRGVDLREQDIRDGSALRPARLRQLFGWARALGATLIRSDPLNPELEEMADRAGVLVWSDIPVSQQGRNFAAPHDLLKQDIFANENHPSILLWSIANELTTPADASEASYIASTATLSHRLDPTRPVGMAISAWPGVGCQPAYGPLDVVGLNEYFGWYDAGGGTTDDRSALSPFLDNLRRCYRRKALFVSEFGFDGARHGPVEDRGTYRFQANAADYHLRVFASKRWLAGAVYFLLQDGVSFPGYTGGDPFPSPPFNLKGLIGFGGAKKPAWRVVRSSYWRTRQIAR